MKTRIAALTFVALVATLSAFADVPDLTAQLEYLGNPAYTRWPGSPMSRHVQDLFPYKGKIYTSGGEWDTNTGPCPIFAVDPYSGAFTNEFDAGTDAIYEFKEFSDGRLYTSAIDMHEGAANIGSTFRRGSNDVWYAYNTACTACNITDFGSFAYEGYRIHNWDMAEWNGYVFVCGYGISGSTNWCTKAMFDTTPQLTSIYRYYDDPKTQSNPDQLGLRRFCTFLPFDDDIYCYPIQESQANNITRFDWEEWRFNESTRKFVCQTNTWANVAPGITLEAASFTFPTNTRADVQLWHPTKFGSRVLYIVGGHGDDGFNIPPWAAYSAVNENHHVKATKIDLGGDDVKPFDICVANGTAYIVAAQAGMKATQVTNSVWKSSDGVSFTKIFTFVSTRQASAICYYDGYFFLGMGSNSFTKNGWPKVTSGDISGRIYRVRLPQGSTPAVVASTNAVTIAEGGSGSVSFRLAAKPATNMTLRVWATDSRIAPSVASLSFTTSNWNVNQTVPFSALEDDESDANFKGAIVCGTGAADCLSASVVVTATNNDFRVIETPPEGLVDLTRPDGNFTTTVPEGVTLTYNKPFNDCDTNTNKEERLVAKAMEFSVAYDFGTPTNVNAYGIVNFANSGYSPVERAPKAWTFEGSNDGTTWTQLDIRRFEKGWTAGEYRYYSFANTASYRFYRISITANNGNEYTQFARLEYYHVGGAVIVEPPDLTAELEYLGNPAYSRWPNSGISRHVQDLVPHKGKIFTSGGEWGNNTGPCPCFAVDPYSGAYTNEFDAGTDTIYEFKEFSDGRLYTCAVDIHEGAAHQGSTFRRGTNGVWGAYNTACGACNITNFGSSAYQGYKIHNWDMAEWKNYQFVCGYGISGSTNWYTKTMFDVTPQLRDMNRMCAPVKIPYPAGFVYDYADGYSILRRFCAFLPFDDDIYCIPMQPVVWNDIQHWDWEEWRFNESTKRFVCQTNTWDNIAPGVTLESASFTLPSNVVEKVQIWHPTKFGSRVLYIVGEHHYNIVPWTAFSAVNENHHVKATKIDLGGDDVKPFDICVADGAAYIVAAQAGLKATMVTNSVWKSTDGVSFNKIFTFVSTRQASAICYYDGCFYLGLGSNACTKNGWPKVAGSDISGRIYRVRLPQGSAPSVVASANVVAASEGGSGSVAFRLSAKPATNMTVRVWSTDPRIVPSVATLTFTTSNWNVNQSATFSVLEDDYSDEDYQCIVVCGTGAADCISAPVSVTVANNDFRVVETAPEGLVDLTSPEGDWMTTIAVTDSTHYVYADSPFNDCAVNDSTNKTDRFLVRSAAVTVQYRFDSPTIVNAYGIVNYARANLSPVERAPRIWTFEGSSDGTTWTQLDIRRIEKNWTAGEYRYYSFTNETAYSFYRIVITASNGNEYIQFARMEMYGTAGQGGDPDPDPDPPVSDFAKKTTFTPSSTALAKLGSSSWTNFPVLVRLPASVSSQLRSAGGTDLRVEDESGAELPFEVETFDPTGTTFVWVKVPALSSSTKLTVFFSGAANTNNDPTAVWSRYAGVWHFAPSAVGTMTVPDATGHGLDGTATNTLSAYAGPAGLGALQAGAVVRAPDYEAKLANVAQFSASGWFKAPTQVDSWWTPVSKKIGITTGPNGENLWNVDKGWYLQLPQVKNNLRLVYTSTAQMAIPDVTENWNYFQVVSDGSTLKVYLNGSSTASKSVSYTVKASGTPYQMCPKDGCSREYRVRIGAASAAETALEYATMADENFFAMGEIETVGVFVPAPAFGGEGVPAPSFGVDQSSGSKVFTFSIGNAVKGVKYRIYRTESLTAPFEPYGVAIEATVDGILDFAVPTADAPSCFFKIVTE